MSYSLDIVKEEVLLSLVDFAVSVRCGSDSDKAMFFIRRAVKRTPWLFFLDPNPSDENIFGFLAEITHVMADSMKHSD